MPDLQYSATHNDTMVRLRDHILPVKCKQSRLGTLCPTLTIIQLNTAAGADLTRSVGPSAEFMQMPVNFNYRYAAVCLLPFQD
jgi:general transcription factor 3C polypeptide 5 (transcription factor C subunit 1)